MMRVKRLLNAEVVIIVTRKASNAEEGGCHAGGNLPTV